MKSRQSGFTLIELVMVIVILGVLAAVAIPKFKDLSSDASTAAVQSVAGSLAAAAATNYAVRSLKVTYGTAMTTCASVATALQGGAVPTAGGVYVISDGSSAVGATAVAAGVVGSCTLTFTPTGGAAVTSTFQFTSIA